MDFIIYTDGACKGNPGPGGWGFVMQDLHTKKFSYGSGGDPATTNNRMELLGAINALQVVPENAVCSVFTDSKYVHDSVTKGWARGWKSRGWRKSDGSPALNSDLWQELLALLEKRSVQFNWVKGHAGNELNEYCDKLAVAASLKAAGGVSV